jgi:cell division topological specificity factor
MRFFRFGRQQEQDPPPSQSSAIAKQRLKVVLVHDHMRISPGMLAAIREDLASVLSRRFEIDPSGIDVTITPGQGSDELVARVPFRRAIGAYR